MFRTALVMLAFDDRDDSVLDVVAGLAREVDLQRVLLAHVYARDPFPPWMEAEPQAPTPERPAALDAALDRLQQQLPEVEIVGVHAVGVPAEELGRIVSQEDVDLLVIGRNPTHEGMPGWGPSGRQLIRSVTCSALVVPRGAHLDLAHAVAGVDFSPRSLEALQVAAELANHAEGVFQYPLGREPRDPQVDADLRRAVAEDALRHWDQEVLPRFEGRTRPSLCVAHGDDAATVLVEQARGALIVVGSRGLTRLASVLLGSTAEAVAGLARGPVLIVRHKGESMGLIEGLLNR